FFFGSEMKYILVIIKVQENDERSFPQKQNLIKVKLDTPTKTENYTQRHPPSQTPKNTTLLNNRSHHHKE
ncbi:hypothetical protein, partial [Vibrio cholerae]|uniref:hypothetical protein n=1 Tax=Vibrio cholerae TaxID=666 RepID=UPI001F1750B9